MGTDPRDGWVRITPPIADFGEVGVGVDGGGASPPEMRINIQNVCPHASKPSIRGCTLIVV